MKALRSTVAIAILGLALTIGGIASFAVLGIARIGNLFVWCVVAVLVGVPLTLGAVAREVILRAPAGKFKGLIGTGFLGGAGIGWRRRWRRWCTLSLLRPNTCT
jgi:hypothetical protein